MTIVSAIQHVARNARQAVNALKEGPRSPHWPRVQKEHLAKQPACVACGGVEHLNVHHIKPFHMHPELELDDNNLITLCMAQDKHCHLLVGHGDDFKAANLNVLTDAVHARNLRQQLDVAGLASLLASIKLHRSYAQ